MNKLKQIGLTALAGTLASVSAAQAGAVTVGGTAELSWVDLPSSKVTGQQLGQKKNISFSGSGEFANGWTYGVFHAMTDAMDGLSSSSMNINMGGIATLAYDSGTGGYGANAVDNVVPTAWEEIDYGLTGLSDVGSVSKAKGVVNFTATAPGSGTSISFSYASRMSAGHVADGGTSGDVTSGGNHGMDVRLDFWNVNTSWFDIRTGAAAQKVDHSNCRNDEGNVGKIGGINKCNTSVMKGDAYAGTIYQTLGIGPLSAGFQATYKDPGTGGGTENNQAWVAGVALTIGNFISLSCGKGEDQYYWSDEFAMEGIQTTEGHGKDKIVAHYRGCSAAGNWGPLALKWTQNSVGNEGGTHNSNASNSNDEEHSEINLSMAF